MARPGTIALGFGYRSQVTTNAATRQQLNVFPAPVALIGIAGGSEVIVEPGLSFSRRYGDNGSGLGPMRGQQDAGIGLQHVVGDRPWSQQALGIFATYPTGYPTGPSGFSSGAASYQAAYTTAFTLSPTFAATLGNTLLVARGFASDNSSQRYVAYQPSLTLALTITPSTTLIFADQFSTLAGPHGPAADRALLGVQYVASPRVVIDLEYEQNLVPPAGFRQHTTFEGGMTLQL